MSTRFLQIIFTFILISTISCKIYDRCELARELLFEHEIPKKFIATWVCLARHESEYNSSAINFGSGDHGLFQISELFWCSPPGYACGVSCESLRDDDITNDVICAKRIYREHRRLSGDGFNAWVVYGLYCKDKNYANELIKGCFDLDGPGDNHLKFTNSPTSTPYIEQPTISFIMKEKTTDNKKYDYNTFTSFTTTRSPPKTTYSFGENNNAHNFPVTKDDQKPSKNVNNGDPKQKDFSYTINKTGFSLKQLLKNSSNC